jgi:hypothetical protein
MGAFLFLLLLFLLLPSRLLASSTEQDQMKWPTERSVPKAGMISGGDSSGSNEEKLEEDGQEEFSISSAEMRELQEGLPEAIRKLKEMKEGGKEEEKVVTPIPQLEGTAKADGRGDPMQGDDVHQNQPEAQNSEGLKEATKTVEWKKAADQEESRPSQWETLKRRKGVKEEHERFAARWAADFVPPGMADAQVNWPSTILSNPL